MKLFGVTGGIGSGKSLVCRVLTSMNFPVYSSDERAKFLQNNHPEIIQETKELLGEQAYLEGVLNTKFISEKVFANSDLRLQLNQIVHPRVKDDFEQWKQQQTAPCIFQESALIYEIGREHLYDQVLLITAPMEVRIERVITRDGSTEEQVRQRIKNQLSDEEKRTRGPIEIVNDGIQPLLPQILAFLDTYSCINL